MTFVIAPAAVSFPIFLNVGKTPVHRSDLCLQATPILPKAYNVSGIWQDRDGIIDALSGAVSSQSAWRRL